MGDTDQHTETLLNADVPLLPADAVIDSSLR